MSETTDHWVRSLEKMRSCIHDTTIPPICPKCLTEATEIAVQGERKAIAKFVRGLRTERMCAEDIARAIETYDHEKDA